MKRSEGLAVDLFRAKLRIFMLIVIAVLVLIVIGVSVATSDTPLRKNAGCSVLLPEQEAFKMTKRLASQQMIQPLLGS